MANYCQSEDNIIYKEEEISRATSYLFLSNKIVKKIIQIITSQTRSKRKTPENNLINK